MVRRVRGAFGPRSADEPLDSILEDLGPAIRPPGFEEAQAPYRVDAPSSLEPERVSTVLAVARSAGMLDAKTARISGRVSPALVERAKLRTGLTSDSDLIEFALASLAVDDDFAAVFRRVRGTLDSDLPLGY